MMIDFDVLRPGGKLAVFDGDYASTTFAIGDHDPLEQCATAAMSAFVHDRWLVRKLPRLVKAAGFAVERFDSHGYLQSPNPESPELGVERKRSGQNRKSPLESLLLGDNQTNR